LAFLFRCLATFTFLTGTVSADARRFYEAPPSSRPDDYIFQDALKASSANFWNVIMGALHKRSADAQVSLSN
jgi:hypothetical protein